VIIILLKYSLSFSDIFMSLAASQNFTIHMFCQYDRLLNGLDMFQPF